MFLDDENIKLRLSGTITKTCIDVFYIAHKNNEGLSRLWMG